MVCLAQSVALSPALVLRHGCCPFGPATESYVWGSAALFLRARREGDLQRFLKLPYRDYLAPALLALIFLPCWRGSGCCVASIILPSLICGGNSSATAVVLVSSAAAGGGFSFPEDVRRRRRGWRGGEGTLDVMRDRGASANLKQRSGIPQTWIQRFETARREM